MRELICTRKDQKPIPIENLFSYSSNGSLNIKMACECLSGSFKFSGQLELNNAFSWEIISDEEGRLILICTDIQEIL